MDAYCIPYRLRFNLQQIRKLNSSILLCLVDFFFQCKGASTVTFNVPSDMYRPL